MEQNCEASWNSILDYATMMRSKLKELETIARDFSDFIKLQNEDKIWNKWEVIAQSILGMRHIEDARMKYGKVIQYNNIEDLNSVFDK